MSASPKVLSLALLALAAVAASRASAQRSEHEPETETAAPAPKAPASAPEGRATPADAMVRIPGGTFQMGSDGLYSQPNERPVHAVTLGAYYVDRTEVTVGAVRACVARGACLPPPPSKRAHCTFPGGPDDLPVNCVAWEFADAYCRAIDKRLPTEAEWEFAAHGSEHIRYPWGAAPPSCSLAVTLRGNRTAISCSPAGPAPVGTHARGASPFGVQDLAGNVEEWVADFYADHYEVGPNQAARSPSGPGWGVAHVLRGGGWLSVPRDARASARNWGSPGEAGPNAGFRCARD